MTMETFTKGKWVRINRKVVVEKPFKKAAYTRVDLRQERDTVSEKCFFRTVNFTWESGKMIKSTELEFTFTKITVFIKALLVMIMFMVMVSSPTQILAITKAIFKKGKNMEKDFL